MHSHDAAHGPLTHPARVDNTSRFPRLASAAEGSNCMAAGAHGVLQHPTPATADGHKLGGLPAARAVEGLSKDAPSGACRELTGADLMAGLPIIGNERKPEGEGHSTEGRHKRHSVTMGRYPRTCSTPYTTEITPKRRGAATASMYEQSLKK
jgi:hypothetical protein